MLSVRVDREMVGVVSVGVVSLEEVEGAETSAGIRVAD